MNFYVRATGANRFAGGTGRWLRIRNIKQKAYGYVLEVYFRGSKKFVAIKGNEETENIEFAEGWPTLKPVSHTRVLNVWSF